MEGEVLCLKLGRRKNKPEGSLLKRTCWSAIAGLWSIALLLCVEHSSLCCVRCKENPFTCPVHIAWPYFEKLEPGQAAFSGIRPAKALGQLREMLDRLGSADAAIYRTHDLRRGHALDIQERCGSLQEILAADEWKPGPHLA